MTDVQEILMEYAELNQRRLFGCPPLEVEELERLQQLRKDLVQVFKDNPEHERRLHERLPTHLRVDLITSAGERPVTTLNLSEGGLFVATPSILDVGTHLELTLGTMGSALTLQGVVAWTRPVSNEEGLAGMGIRFVETAGQTLDSIREILHLVQGMQ